MTAIGTIIGINLSMNKLSHTESAGAQVTVADAGVVAADLAERNSEHDAQRAAADQRMKEYRAAVARQKAAKAAHDKAVREAAARAAAARKAAAAREKAAKERASRSKSREDVSSSSSSIKVDPGSAQDIARKMVAARGWSDSQFTCLYKLWTKESGWRVNAANPSTPAYGIPQANPGSKMASAGADWKTNPATQIEWGLGYIENRYDTPCGGWNHWLDAGWY